MMIQYGIDTSTFDGKLEDKDQLGDARRDF